MPTLSIFIADVRSHRKLGRIRTRHLSIHTINISSLLSIRKTDKVFSPFSPSVYSISRFAQSSTPAKLSTLHCMSVFPLLKFSASLPPSALPLTTDWLGHTSWQHAFHDAPHWTHWTHCMYLIFPFLPGHWNICHVNKTVPTVFANVQTRM